MKSRSQFILVAVLACAVLASLAATPVGQEQTPPTEGQQTKDNSQSPQTPPAPNQVSPQNQPSATPSDQAPSAAHGSQSINPPPSSPQQTSNNPAGASQKNSNPSHKRKKHLAKSTTSQSGRVVVRNGGAKDNTAQLSPGMSKEQELHSRENTTQLLATTDENLKAVAGRPLSAAQQGMLNQIRTYMRQSKTASDSGDLTRAHTLAYKAHLLSDELAKK